MTGVSGTGLLVRLRTVVKRLLGRFVPATPVIAEWEWYARHHRRAGSAPLGEEWNRPETIGVDVPAGEIVAHLDQRVFGPFLGRPGSILEIGAGGGRFTELLAARAERVIAADTSPAMLALVRERFATRPQVSCLLLDGRGLAPIPDRSLDAAFSYDVFVHLSPWEIHVYLRELARVLKPGGRAVLHHANTLSDLGWKKFLADAERVRQGVPPVAGFSVLTPELMAGFAERAGFRVEASLTEVVRRDCITLLVLPEAQAGADFPAGASGGASADPPAARKFQ
jgi:SAM-dependent methyltransferase